MEDKTLDPKQSLAVIQQMLEATSKQYTHATARPYLVFGYASVLSSLLVYYFLPLWGMKATLLFLLIPVLGIATILIRKARGEEFPAKTQINRFIEVTWAVISSVVFVGSFIMGAHTLIFVALIIGTGATITGLALRLRYLYIPAIIGMLIGTAQYFVSSFGISVLLFALAFVFILCIPGHIMSQKIKAELKH